MFLTNLFFSEQILSAVYCVDMRWQIDCEVILNLMEFIGISSSADNVALSHTVVIAELENVVWSKQGLPSIIKSVGALLAYLRSVTH